MLLIYITCRTLFSWKKVSARQKGGFWAFLLAAFFGGENLFLLSMQNNSGSITSVCIGFATLIAVSIAGGVMVEG